MPLDKLSVFNQLVGSVERQRQEYLSGNDTALDTLIREIKSFDQVMISSLPNPDPAVSYLSNPPPEPPVLIDGLLHLKHTMSISAPSKARKSWLMIGLALSLSNGAKWLGQFQCKKSRVLLLNFEIDPGLYWHHRVKVIAQKLGLEVNENLFIQHLRGYPITVEAVLERITTFISENPVDIIIADPFYKLLQSTTRRNIDENSASDISFVLQQISSLLLKNMSVIWSSHFAKGISSGKQVEDRMSGSGVFARDPDAIISVSPLDSPDPFFEGYRMEFRLRNFAPQQPMSLRWEYPIHVCDASLNSLKLKSVGGCPQKISDDDIIRVWQENRKSGNSVPIEVFAEELDCNEKTVRRRIKNMIRKEFMFYAKDGLVFGKQSKLEVKDDGVSDQVKGFVEQSLVGVGEIECKWRKRIIEKVCCWMHNTTKRRRNVSRNDFTQCRDSRLSKKGCTIARN